MYLLRNKKISILFLLISAISGFLAKPASAELVSPGETIRFIASNKSDSAGSLEGIKKVEEIKMPPFVTVKENLLGTISKGEVGELVFTVHEAGKGEPRSGKISFKYSINMVTPGLLCISQGWNDKKGAWAKAEYWTREIEIKLPDDVDNSDPTYIQLSRQAPLDAPEQTPYQFSPRSSPGIKDTLEIDYKLKQNSLLSILIYDSNDKLVRALINNQPRNAASHIDTWDGKDDSGESLSEGNYRFIINAINALNPLEVYEITGDAIIDNTLPAVSIDFIKADTPQYGHYTAIGSVADTHLEHYLLESLQDTTPILIERKNTEVKKDILTSFNGFSFKEGSYTLRLSAKDFAGNSSISETPLIVDRTHNGLKVHINSLSKITDLGDGLCPNDTIFSELKPIFQLMVDVLR